MLTNLTSYTLVIFLFAATNPGGELLFKVGSNASTKLIDSGLFKYRDVAPWQSPLCCAPWTAPPETQAVILDTYTSVFKLQKA